MSPRHVVASLIVAAVLAVGAGCASCGEEPEGVTERESAEEPENDAERAALIAEQIDEDPDDAEAILEEHGMTIEEFEKLMYDVAADPKLSEQYDEARQSSE